MLMILTACGGGRVAEYNPHIGTEGLVIDFMPNTPPAEVYEKSQFSIGFDAHNQGAADVDKAKIVFTYERSLFEEFENVYYANLMGKSFQDPYGERDSLMIDMQAKTIFLSEMQDTEIRITYCYPYTTTFSTDVCIDPDIYDERDYKPPECPERPRTFPSGQGAPVAVTGMELKMVPTPTGVIPTFQFDVENVGIGHVIAKEAYEKACSSTGLTPKEVGWIDVSKVYLGHDQLRCKRNQLRIEQVQEGNEYYDVERTLMECSGSEIPYEEEAYLGSITMTMEYGYQDESYAEMTILKSPTFD